MEKNETVIFNDKLGRLWLKGFKGLVKDLGLSGEISPELLLQVPDLYRVEEDRSLTKAEKNLVQSVLKKAIEACVKERAREGKALKADILGHLRDLEKQQAVILKLRKKSEKFFKEKYALRLQRLQDSEEIDPTRMMHEVALLVEKTDISEELQRLKMHISEVVSLVVKGGRVGKKLDFFAQELLREINTIGSKSAMAEITQSVVQGKSIIEKFREQVQNVE